MEPRFGIAFSVHYLSPGFDKEAASIIVLIEIVFRILVIDKVIVVVIVKIIRI